MKDFDKNITREAIDKATSEFSSLVYPLGFIHSKKWFWVREKEASADFIHLHLDGISYGAPINYSVSFRVHCGNRNFNDSFEALALNGPYSRDSEALKRKYHHSFNAKSGSTYERCIEDLMKFVKDIGEPWFAIASFDTSNCQNTENLKLSRKLLGLKASKTNNT